MAVLAHAVWEAFSTIFFACLQAVRGNTVVRGIFGILQNVLASQNSVAIWMKKKSNMSW